MTVTYNVDVELEITDEVIKKMVDLGIDLNNEEEVCQYFEDEHDVGFPCSCINDVQFDYDKFLWKIKNEMEG